MTIYAPNKDFDELETISVEDYVGILPSWVEASWYRDVDAGYNVVMLRFVDKWASFLMKGPVVDGPELRMLLSQALDQIVVAMTQFDDAKVFRDALARNGWTRNVDVYKAIMGAKA